jgi:hypothetical protein
LFIAAIGEPDSVEGETGHSENDDRQAYQCCQCCDSAAELDDFSLELDDIEIKHVDRHDFSGRLCKPTARRRRRYSAFGREFDITGRLDEFSQAMVVSA